MKRAQQNPKTARQFNIAERRAKVAALYLRGRTQSEIAAELGCSRFLVTKDIRALMADWQRRAEIDIAAHIAVELERINRLEARTWEAYEKSCLPKKTTSARRRTHRIHPSLITTESARVVERPEGDPRFLMIIGKCCDLRCKLLGLYYRDRVEEKTQPSTTYGGFGAGFFETQKQNGNDNAESAIRPARCRFDPNRLP